MQRKTACGRQVPALIARTAEQLRSGKKQLEELEQKVKIFSFDFYYFCF